MAHLSRSPYTVKSFGAETPLLSSSSLGACSSDTASTLIGWESFTVNFPSDPAEKEGKQAKKKKHRQKKHFRSKKTCCKIAPCFGIGKREQHPLLCLDFISPFAHPSLPGPYSSDERQMHLESDRTPRPINHLSHLGVLSVRRPASFRHSQRKNASPNTLNA